MMKIKKANKNLLWGAAGVAILAWLVSRKGNGNSTENDTATGENSDLHLDNLYRNCCSNMTGNQDFRLHDNLKSWSNISVGARPRPTMHPCTNKNGQSGVNCGTGVGGYKGCTGDSCDVGGLGIDGTLVADDDNLGCTCKPIAHKAGDGMVGMPAGTRGVKGGIVTTVGAPVRPRYGRSRRIRRGAF